MLSQRAIATPEQHHLMGKALKGSPNTLDLKQWFLGKMDQTIKAQANPHMPSYMRLTGCIGLLILVIVALNTLIHDA